MNFKPLLRNASIALSCVLFAHVAWSQTGTGSVAAGNGTLSFSYDTEVFGCEVRPGLSATYKLTIFSNFSYTVNGATTQLSGPGSGDADDEWGFTRTGGTCIVDPPDDAVFTLPDARITFTPQGQSGSATVENFVTGYVNPKYLIMGVTYAPPGQQSYVQYTSTNMLGTTAGVSDTFATGTSVSVSVGNGGKIAGWASGKITTTTSTSFTQSSTTSSSITTSLQTALSTKTTGVSDSFNPVNHDYDIIWLWLNPVSVFTLDPQNTQNVTWNGYGFDMADQPAMDIFPVYVGYLNGDWGAIPPTYTQALSRSWATNQTFPSGQSAAITSADYPAILAADPFTNPNYTFSLASGVSPATTVDNRFTISGGANGSTQDFVYLQAAPGQQPITQSFTSTYTNNSTQGQSSTQTNQVAFGVDVSFSSSAFIASFNYDLKYQNTFTWTATQNSSINTVASQADTLSLTGPPCNSSTAPCVPVYTGPGRWDVYQDNIYGSFMFHPL